MRMRGEAVTQNRWQFQREGAWLKPMAGGARVDLARVDRMQVRILRKGDAPVRWCQTAITATVEEPPRLITPHLPKGALLDAFGQSAIRQWPGKTHGEPELRQRLEGAARGGTEPEMAGRFFIVGRLRETPAGRQAFLRHSPRWLALVARQS